MNTDSLTAIGLSELQALAYALLIEDGTIKPAQAAKKLATTRTNAYKLYDGLVEMDLAVKKEVGKTFAYIANNPMSLASLSSQKRAEAAAHENAVNNLMPQLLEKYYEHTQVMSSETAVGRKAVAELYRKQINLKEDVHFIHTKADVSSMGFDTMHEIRVAPARNNNQRYGILSAPAKGPVNYENHRRSNLSITWIDRQSYSAPVEWSVTKSSLLIASYAGDPQALLIVDKVIAGAFLQIWQILNGLLVNQQIHKDWAED